nr:hypothetical protein [Bathymodiolus japonicus methanotrophic gill symbiont]
MVLLATSPGAGGAAKVLATAVSSVENFNGDLKASLSIPSFKQNFDSDNNCLINHVLNEKLQVAMHSLL